MRAALLLLVSAATSSCVGPPPSHALVVRHPELKCALIAFSGCGAFGRTEPDEDAGVTDEE